MGFFDKLKKWLKPKNEKIKDANRVTNYGGGVKRNDTASEVKRSIQKAEKAKEKRQETQERQATTRGSAFKATPPSVKKAEAKDKQTSKPTRSNAFKATPPTIKHQSTALGTMSDLDAKTRLAKMNAYNENRKYQSRAADKLKPLIEAKYSGDTLESKQRIKSGEWMSDPNVAKYDVLKHPIANSLARGGLSGATLGLSDLAAAKLTKGEAREAEELYQANKNKLAEGIGTFAGAMLPYAGTAKAFENLGVKAVGRAAETQVGKRLGAEALAKAMSGTGAKSALARSLVGDAIQDSTLGLVDTAAGVAQRDDLETINDYLKAIAKGQLANYGMGLAGNVVSNAAPAFKAFNGEADRGVSRVFADDLAARATRNANSGVDRINIRDMARKPEVKAEAPKIEVEPKAKAEANAKAVKPKTEIQKNEIAIKGEQAKTGERTEFKRDTAESVKEQARNKRATNNRQKATQETFDKDFNAFEEKISEAQTLRDKVRAASGEEKEALQKRLDKLNDEIKSARNQASLRYHPDRGGSDEWMGKFNDTYKDYRRGSYSSKSFKSAESSTRAKTATGDGGNTPPPRRAKAATGEDGFKKPKGKTKKATRTVSSVEDLVHKKKQKAVERENLKEAYHVAKTKVVNSMSAFEDANLKTVKTDHEGWKVRNAAVDKTRRHGALSKISVDEGQLKANNKRYSGKVKRVGADGKTYEIDNGQSLKKIYDGMDKKTETAFDAYLLLKHAPDRIREGTPIFDRINLDRGGGEAIKNLNDPKVVKEEAERLLKEHPEFAKKAEEIYQYTQNELQNRVDAGLLSQETASKWMHDHPFYVPTGRDGYFNAVHGNRSGVAGADSLKAATGSDLDIRSIKEQLAEATTRNWRDITTNDLLEKFFGDKVQTGLSANNSLELLDSTVGLSKSKDGRKFYAKIFRNGDIHRVEIDKRFYDSLEDLYKNGSVGKVADTVARAAQKYYSQPFKNLVTSWNPIFLPKNFSRDMGEAFINTRQTKEFAECLAPAWKELATDGQYARALRDSGVSQSNFIDIDAALTHKEKGIGKAIDKFVALQDMTESFPRLSEYMATIKKEGYDLDTGLPKKVVDTIKKDFDYDLGKGLSDFRKGKADIPAEVVDAVKKMGYDATAGVENIPTKVLDIAAANAADITVNFARGGSVGKNLNKGLVPFFNPSVQGWSKFFRNFREQKGVKSTLGLIIKASALGAGVNAVNNFLLEDNPNYQRISARDKANNVIIAFPPVKFDKDGKPHVNNDADLFIKIPMSRFATVYGLPAVNVKNENKMGWAEMLKVGKDAIAPVDPTESSIFAPLYQVQKNETWYGTKIVPEYLEENYSPSEQYDTNTSPLGKALGKATSKLPDEFQVSPKKADYLIDATTGVIGDFALPMSTAIANDNSAKDAGLKTLKKAFTIDSTTQNNLSSRFYSKVEKANKRLNSSKSSNADKAEYDRLNSYKTEISSVTKAIKELQNGNLKANQGSIRELQKIRNDMMQDGIDGKAVPSSYKTLDTIQKHVGTTYAINNFGSSADKKAMKLYGMAKYGELSDKAMAKKMDADKGFYKGVRNIGKLEAKMEKAGFKSNTALSKAVALASVGADDDLFGAYRATKQSRTETANKMVRSRNYFKEGGSESEYVKLEKARKTLGKLTDYDEGAEIDKAEERLAKGEISLAEYHSKEDEIKYNANRSYVGLATSLAQANAPERGYRLYDIKDKNIQKGINLAAMGITARDFRKMSKDLDSDGNGYPSSKEIRAYVANSDIEDKATLYDALYYYKGTYNPFGTPTKYTRAQAAAAGKKNGVEPIGGDDDNKEFNLKAEESGGSWRGGYYRYGRWHRWGSSGGGGGKGKAMDKSAFKGKNASTAKPTYKSLAENLKPANRDVRADYETSSAKYQTAKAAKSAPKPKAKAVAKKTPPKVKFKKYEV